MRNFKILSLIFFMCISIISIAADKVVVTDPAKPIIVNKSNPVFELTLKANPTTGYSWILTNYDTEMIKPLSHNYYPSNVGLETVGAGGYDKWVFKVRSYAFIVPQATNISLIYARPWDMDGAQTYNFKVVLVNDNKTT